jgi:hypothetical protein
MVMKRSEAVEEIRKILAMNGKDNGCGELEEALLHTMESLGMFYCPVEDLGEFQLRVPRGWESEDEEK